MVAGAMSTAGQKRRAAGTAPVAAEAAPRGRILPTGQVPVLPFGGLHVPDPAEYKAVDRAVHLLGGKASANGLVVLVEQEVAARLQAEGGGQPAAAASACDGEDGDNDGESSKRLRSSGKPKGLLRSAVDAAVASKSAVQIARMGGEAEGAKLLTRVVVELTSVCGVLRYRCEWPWLEAGEMPAIRLNVSRHGSRFLTPCFAGHKAIPALLTRADWSREGREFGLNLEEYLTPAEEIGRMKAALAYYDDRNLWCCFTADETRALRGKRAIATAMAKELISFIRDSEPSSSSTWETEWPYAVCTGADGGSNKSVVCGNTVRSCA